MIIAVKRHKQIYELLKKTNSKRLICKGTKKYFTFNLLLLVLNYLDVMAESKKKTDDF